MFFHGAWKNKKTCKFQSNDKKLDYTKKRFPVPIVYV